MHLKKLEEKNNLNGTDKNEKKNFLIDLAAIFVHKLKILES